MPAGARARSAVPPGPDRQPTLTRCPRAHQPCQQIEEQLEEGLEVLLGRAKSHLVGQRMRRRPIDRGSDPRQPLDAPIKLQPTRRPKLQCPAHAALCRCAPAGPRLAYPAAPCPPPPVRRRRPRARARRRVAPDRAGGSASGWWAAGGSAPTESNRNSARAGGSSSDFRSALAALRLSSSAESTITTRQASSPLVSPRNDFSRRTSSTGMVLREPLGFAVIGPAQHQQAGMRKRRHLPRCAGSRRPLRRLCPVASRSSGRASTCRARR